MVNLESRLAIWAESINTAACVKYLGCVDTLDYGFMEANYFTEKNKNTVRIPCLTLLPATPLYFLLGDSYRQTNY